MKKSAQLSQEQLKKSLSAKQNRAKLKNVLADPFPKYWPLLPKNAVPELREILKSEMLENDGNVQKNKTSKPDPNFITYGLSAVVRKLKANKASSLLLSTSLEPRFVIHQLIQLALSRNPTIKILCVEKLEDILKELEYPATSALALINQSGTNTFSRLQAFISNESEKFPIPSAILPTPDEKKSIDEKRKKPKSLLPEGFQPFRLYLTKLSWSKERFFQPKTLPQTENDVSSESAPKMEVDDEELMSSENPPETDETDTLSRLTTSSKRIKKVKKKKSKNPKTSFFPLIVNRIKPNPKKKKTKGK
ncbi:hypothetical protein DMENIID0001_021630 [Sergentomyia squamirostris]